MSDSHVLLPPLMCFQSKRFVTNTDPGNRDPLVIGIAAINCEKLFPLPIQRSSRDGGRGVARGTRGLTSGGTFDLEKGTLPGL